MAKNLIYFVKARMSRYLHYICFLKERFKKEWLEMSRLNQNYRKNYD